VHRARKIPHYSELGVGLIVATAVLFLDLRASIGFSSFAILVYYAIANAAAFTLPSPQRRWPRWMAVAGGLSCLLLALNLPLVSVLSGAALFGCGTIFFLIFRRKN